MFRGPDNSRCSTRADRPEAKAAELFRYRCQPCHGSDGKAQTQMGAIEPMPDMTDPAWQGGKTDAELKAIITNGAKRPHSHMIGFKDRLTAEEIDTLIPYLRQLKGR